MFATLAQVMIGGGIGAGLRFGMGRAVTAMTGPGFPLAILSVNVLGSFLMGVFVVLAAGKGPGYWAPFVQIGVLGGFTTFSSFSLEAMTLIERGAPGQAMVYILLSVGASIGGLYLGLLVARGLVT